MQLSLQELVLFLHILQSHSVAPSLVVGACMHGMLVGCQVMWDSVDEI